MSAARRRSMGRPGPPLATGAVLIAGLLLGLALPASAVACSFGPTSIETIAAQSTLIVEGTVVPSDGGPASAIAVSAVLKGQAGPLVHAGFAPSAPEAWCDTRILGLPEGEHVVAAFTSLADPRIGSAWFWLFDGNGRLSGVASNPWSREGMTDAELVALLTPNLRATSAAPEGPGPAAPIGLLIVATLGGGLLGRWRTARPARIREEGATWT